MNSSDFVYEHEFAEFFSDSEDDVILEGIEVMLNLISILSISILNFLLL